MFIGIIWNGMLSTNDMIYIRKRVLHYILDCDLKHMITINMRISLGNKTVYDCDRISMCLKNLAEDFERILTIKRSSHLDNYIQDSFKDYYEKSSNTGAINVAYIFTNYPNEMWSNDSNLKLMEEMSNLTSIIQEQKISTKIVHYTDRGEVSKDRIF
uniref:Uncharacterized protein n=1 Tax=Acrobeloides nanus TaxID=290746 RepID=A0A914CV33_9BILA